MSDMTKEACEGYRAVLLQETPKSPYIWSSNSDAAWRIGVWLRISGRTEPRDCRPSRGNTFGDIALDVPNGYAPGCGGEL